MVEVSSFQLETTVTFHPWIAALLNLSADHLDRHANLREYAAAKARVFANQGAGDWVVVNADDAPAMRLAARRARAPKRFFALDRALEEGTVVSNGWIVWRATGPADVPLLPVGEVRLLGRHLLSDVLAASTVAMLAGAGPDAIRGAVAGFEGLEHALEPVATLNGVRFVNDSKATNVESARRAIESFDRASSRSSAAASRGATSATCDRDWRASGGGGRHRRGAGGRCAGRWPTWSR